MSDASDVSVSVDHGDGKEAPAGAPTSGKSSRMSLKDAGNLVIAGNKKPAEKLLQAVQDARMAAGQIDDSTAAARNANKAVLIDSMGHAGGFASSFMMLRTMKPDAPSIISTCLRLFKALCNMEGLIAFVLFFTSLGYAAAVCCLPRFVNLCFAIIYKGPDAQGISLEKFTTWSLFYIFFLLGSGTVQQWMFVLGRTSLCNDFTRLLIHTKMTLPKSIGGNEIAEMATGDVLALKSFWQGVHCGFRALCWAIVSAVLVFVEVPALGALMLGLGVFYFLAGLLYDVFCIEKSNFSTEEYVRATITKVEMISRKKDLNGDNGELGSERDVLDEIDSFHRSDLMDQHVHVYARAVQNLMVLISPILILYLSNHLVKEGELDAVDIGYVLCYLGLGAWSVMAFNRNCNLIMDNAARATRLITFGNELADAEILKRKRAYRTETKKSGTAESNAPSEIKDGLGGEKVLLYMGVKKAGIVLVLGVLGIGFVVAAIYNCAAMKDHISCSNAYAVCSLEDVTNGPRAQWMVLAKQFSSKRGCVFESSDSKILFQCSNAMQKSLKGTYAFGTYGTVQVKFGSWVDNYRVLQRQFQLPNNGNANNLKFGSTSLGRRRLRQAVVGTSPTSNEYVVGLAPDGQYEATPAGSVPPAEWTCSSSYYNANDGCDCNCGASDPDCAIPGSYVYGCMSGDTCPNDSCVAPSPEGDSSSSSIPVLGPPDISAVDTATPPLVGTSTILAAISAWDSTTGPGDNNLYPTTTAELIATGWNTALCNPAYFNAQDGCDCGCGAYDPDCDNMPNGAFYMMGPDCLASHDTCSPEGQCASSAVVAAGNSTETLLGMMTPMATTSPLLTPEVIDATPTPTPDGNDVTQWTCPIMFYNAADGCDCGCGTFDPDCLLPNQYFYGNGPSCNVNSNYCNPSTAICEVTNTTSATPAPPAVPPPAVVPPPAEVPSAYGFTPSASPTTPASPPVAPPVAPPPPPPPPSPPPTPTEAATSAAAAAAVAESTVTTVTSTSPPATCSVVADPVAAGWTAPLDYYNAQDGCDCGYGLCDPDCNGQASASYNQDLYNCDSIFGLSSTWDNFRCVSGTCQPLSASVAAMNNCPCNIYGADNACACNEPTTLPSTTTPSASPSSSSTSSFCTSTASSFAGASQWTECVTETKNCSAWLDSYSFIYAHRNPIVLTADLGNCQQMNCNKIGNKYCDPELNNAACAYDGGDCCVRTTTNEYIGDGAGLECNDPDAEIVETWESIRTPAIPSSLYQYWDHISRSILNISESFSIASGTFYQDALNVLYSEETKAMESTWGWDAEEKLGKVQVYDVAIPNYMNATALPIVLSGAYMDFHINATAGQYLNVYLDAPFDATLELIAPQDDGSVADPSATNNTLPNHRGAQEWQAALDTSAPSYNATACGAWLKDNCSCYACFCSCGNFNVLASEFALGLPKSKQFLNHCIPEYNDPHGCNGAHTVHYDLYLEPDSSGITIDIEMERSHGGSWPMIVELYQPMSDYQVTDNKCEINSNSVVECCWPYTADCPPRYSDQVIGMAAGAMVIGGAKKLRNFVTEKGYYRIQTKSYGYGGGGYNLDIQLSSGSGTPLTPETITYSNGGALSYGEVQFGNITFTGEQHAYTFEGTKGDLVFVHMGPAWVPSADEANAQCGRPYGTGKACLDTMLVLESPLGLIEAANHVNNRDRDLVGSTIGTALIRANPWYYETATGQSGFAIHKSVPHVLKETGTYTVYASGSTVRTKTGSKFNGRYSPVGEYYVQVLRVQEHASVEKECATRPEGDDMDGCANFLWSVFSGEPRHAKRHPQCEKYLPQSSPVGSYTEDGQINFKDHLLKKTGTYTLRVRSLINNCFGFSITYCKPYSGSFDIKARVRNTPNTGPPNHYVPTDGITESATIRKHLVPLGATRVIKDKCEDTTSGGNVTEICYSTIAKEKKCKDTYAYYSAMSMDDQEYYMADLAFNVTAGDVICISSSLSLGQGTGMLRLTDGAGNHVAAAEGSMRGVGEDDGVGIFGYKSQATQEMVARFEGFYITDAEVSVSLCPEEHVDARLGDESSGNLSGQDCSSYSEKFEWDGCFSSDADVVVRGDNVTFTNPSNEKILLGKLGLDIDTAVDRYYFEIELDGTEPIFRYDTTSNEELDWAIGFATRSVKTDGWLGIDDQSHIWRGGRKYNDAGSSGYGEKLYPGDIIGIGWDGVDRKMFMSKNGYWQSPGGCNFDIAGMKYNNYPEALCMRDTYGFSCDRRNPIAGMSWSYSAENMRYEYLPDPSAGEDPHGYNCCPIPGLNQTDPIQTNPNNYNKPYPRCTMTAYMPEILGNKVCFWSTTSQLSSLLRDSMMPWHANKCIYFDLLCWCVFS